MTDKQLHIEYGACSDKGLKPLNQDFHAMRAPDEPLLGMKGVVMALADGISTSPVSQEASEAAVKSFIADYFCTSEAWSVKTSALRVLTAINSWLYSQTRNSHYRFEREKGYICTFSALIIKSTTAHIVHVGDSRVYRVFDQSLEQLTHDHRVWISEDQSYLSRGLGIEDHLEIDYHSLNVEEGDLFLLATDGIYTFVSEASMASIIKQNIEDLHAAATKILELALAQGSDDNLTVQILRVKRLPQPDVEEIYQQAKALPMPPLLEPRMLFDGYRIVRELHASSRSHVYLALDETSHQQVVLKIPSIDLRDQPAYIERFLLEDWIARRINSAHVLRPCEMQRRSQYCYIVTEYIEGQTLEQWMHDHPRVDLQTVRMMIEQIAKGLRAFHRLEMLHQDLRPANIMIDKTGTIKIIDFGSTKVAGLHEMASSIEQSHVLGTAQYTAPEYFLGEEGCPRSDLFSLGVIAYQMLTGKLPYGTAVAKIKSRSAMHRLKYEPIRTDRRDVPAWFDDAIMKAVHPDRMQRQEALSEFIYDLKQPNASFLKRTKPPLIERHPVMFWKGVSALLLILLVFMLATK